jgi:hypothetical protein
VEPAFDGGIRKFIEVDDQTGGKLRKSQAIV